MSNDRVKLICPNTKCLNKAPVWRIFNALNEYVCKACKTGLVRYKFRRDSAHNLKAKSELKEMGL